MTFYNNLAVISDMTEAVNITNNKLVDYKIAKLESHFKNVQYESAAQDVIKALQAAGSRIINAKLTPIQLSLLASLIAQELAMNPDAYYMALDVSNKANLAELDMLATGVLKKLSPQATSYVRTK
jgi:UDP-N-acetylglucosamine enolpyruvyl transferase